MSKKIEKNTHDTDQKDHQKKVEELMKDPVVKAHCDLLDKQGVIYQVVPMLPKRKSA